VHALTDCLTIADTMAKKRDILIESNCRSGEFPNVRADQVLFKQVLLNLLSNAIKYNKDGGEVVLNRHLNDDDTCHFVVTDTKHGIPADKQEGFFTPFARLGAENSNIEGTGIGLTISSEIMLLMDGMVGFESTEGVGSSFWIDLPLAGPSVRKESKSYPQPTSQRVPKPASDVVKSDCDLVGTYLPECEVLYIADNPSNLHLMEMILNHEPNVRLVTAHTAEPGIIRAEAENPDVILMDINLPGMSGVDAFKLLRKNPKTMEIPVVAVSANAMPQDIQDTLKVGFINYVTKPFNAQFVLTGCGKNKFWCQKHS
jgi:CheY-like chemotaxis protein